MSMLCNAWEPPRGGLNQAAALVEATYNPPNIPTRCNHATMYTAADSRLSKGSPVTMQGS